MLRGPLVLTLLLSAAVASASPIQQLRSLTTEPVARTESSGYGWREDPIQKHRKFHHGSDYRGKPGTPVVVAGDGVVVLAERYHGYGKAVFVDHGDGLVTRYAHMRKIEVKVGDHVGAGDRIGQVGSTGRTTGPHLHFEVRLDGRSVDPNTALAIAALLRQNPAAGQIAAFVLAPEIQDNAHDAESRPERHGAPKRDRAMW